MKHCPIKGMICDGPDCAWYRAGIENEVGACAVLLIPYYLGRMKR